MKRFFIKYWWIFPFLLTASPLVFKLSTPVLYRVDWSAKLPMLALYALIYLLSFITLLISWIILLRNKQWWKFIISLISSVIIVYAIRLFFHH